MQNTYSLIRSRTFWSAVALFVVTGGNAVLNMFPPTAQIVASAFLTILIAYFHLQTAQTAGAVN